MLFKQTPIAGFGFSGHSVGYLTLIIDGHWTHPVLYVWLLTPQGPHKSPYQDHYVDALTGKLNLKRNVVLKHFNWLLPDLFRKP